MGTRNFGGGTSKEKNKSGKVSLGSDSSKPEFIHRLSGSKMPGATVSMPGVSSIGKSANPNQNYKQWLESKSKEELVALLLTVDAQGPDPYVTGQAISIGDGVSTQDLSEVAIPKIKEFVRLPVLGTAKPLNPETGWRFLLVSVDPTYKPIGLEIEGEITIGRFTGGAMPDLDLGVFGGATKGVSRKHARLHPTPKALMLSDEDSTNGTTCNSTRVRVGAPREIKDQDVIGFGEARFVVMIVDRPKKAA